MQKISILAVLIVAISCSTAKQKVARPDEELHMDRTRGPSSFMGGKNFDAYYQSSVETNTLEQDVAQDLDRVKELNIRGDYFLNEFDKELDESIKRGESLSFDRSESYKKLMVIRNLREKMHDKITFYYLRTMQNLGKPSQKNYFSNIFNRFRAKLNSMDGVDQVVYHDIKNKINFSIDEMRVFDQSISSPELVLAVKEKDFAEKIPNYNKYRKQQLHDGFKRTQLDDEIDSLASDVKFSDKELREPQSTAKYMPALTTNGNIVGGAFPKNTWALTYDDGPNPVHTPKILANLEELNHKATFFWLAQNVIQYKSVVDLAKEKGMARENHSWSHAQLTKLDDNKLQKEVVLSTNVETEAYGEKIGFFRCPYGAGTNVPRIRKMIAEQEMIHVFWNVDTLDWQDKNPDSIFERAKKQMIANGHGVVLFHDVHPQSVIASKKLMEWADSFKGSEKEVRWVTLPEIVDELNVGK